MPDRGDHERHAPTRRGEGFRDFRRRYFTWIVVTRIMGLAGLVYEIVVDKIDRPSVMIVLGAMILGAESIRNIFGGGPG